MPVFLCVGVPATILKQIGEHALISNQFSLVNQSDFCAAEKKKLTGQIMAIALFPENRFAIENYTNKK